MFEIWYTLSTSTQIGIVIAFIIVLTIIILAIKGVFTETEKEDNKITTTTTSDSSLVTVSTMPISGTPITETQIITSVLTPSPNSIAPAVPLSPPVVAVPAPVAAPSIKTPTPFNSWQCVSGWNAPIRVENGKIQCLGGTSCQPLGNSTQCEAVATKLNTDVEFLKGIQSINNLRLCQLNDPQTVPCGYTISNDGKISVPIPTGPKSNEWQCVAGWNGPVKYVNGEVHCTGSTECMEQDSFESCQKIALKMRSDPTFEKMFLDLGNVRKCTGTDIQPTPCAWNQTKFSNR